ncbi:ParB/RepB/Spo0J family partition protein [Streptomyces platensis]|uniref:ParB/RepB/Spo0J family partition protein n=1 Tax=Streptomyces platensis TaxID=58346 RepID=UPI0036D033B2
MAKKKDSWTSLLGTNNPKAAGDGEDTGSGPTEPQEPPVTVLMHTIARNPENPRTDADYSDEDDEFRELKASMREIGQLQGLSVVSRDVYLRLKPQHAKSLEAVDWVVVTGNRRLAAARQLGWTRVDIRVQDHLGDDDGQIDEAVIIENIHRKNIDPIKEAEFLQRMVEKHGSQDNVAARIGKSQMYVSHRLALLKLAPDVQEQVGTPGFKIKEARALAGRTQDPEAQRAAVTKMQEEASKPKAKRQPKQAQAQNPVLKPAEEAAVPEQPASVQNPVLKPPAPRTLGEDGQPDRHDQVAKDGEGTRDLRDSLESVHENWLPLQKPEVLARALQERMTPSNFEQMVKVAQTLI